jgi:pyruvate/2-oxoglutarate dehydrogenase complex dihydrolipoamide dehydrogenase (E3) component
MPHTFDAILVGAGQAAPSLAHRLVASGMKIAFAERKLFGGTCVNNGCIPTKAWVASAHAAYQSRRAWEFGIEVSGPVATDMARVKSRKDEIVKESHDGVEQGLRNLKGCTVFDGTAAFEGPHQMRVGDQILEAPQIFLNLGARAMIPNIAGLSETKYLTNVSILQLDTLPDHLIILGGSFVALEFAQIFRRLGSDVTILQRGPRLLTREDEDVAAAIAAIFAKEGIEVLTGVRPTEVKHHWRGVEVVWPEGAVDGSHLLVATGRRPNTDDLQAERAGITLNKEGFIQVNDVLEAAPGIWAIGDCNGHGAFTHTSYNDFEIVAANLLDKENRKVTDRITAYNLYVDPPLGRCGLSEAQVRASGKPALKGVRPMTRVTRARLKGETQGFLKVLVDKESGLILGASLLGVGCDEVVHCLLDVMYARKPYTLLTHAVHSHPTVSELIPTVLEDLQPL